MKKLNKKGFTLIELLAVIVILAILVAVAIPATMRYLAQARRGTFESNASEMIAQVRNDVTISNLSTGTYYYKLADINNLLEKKITKSPWSAAFDYDGNANYVKVVIASNGSKTYSICLADESGNGYVSDTSETNMGTSDGPVTLGGTSTCAISTSQGEIVVKTYADGRTTCVLGSSCAN